MILEQGKQAVARRAEESAYSAIRMIVVNLQRLQLPVSLAPSSEGRLRLATDCTDTVLGLQEGVIALCGKPIAQSTGSVGLTARRSLLLITLGPLLYFTRMGGTVSANVGGATLLALRTIAAAVVSTFRKLVKREGFLALGAGSSFHVAYSSIPPFWCKPVCSNGTPTGAGG